MADEKELKLAKEAYDTLCSTLDGLNYHYDRDEEKLIVHIGMNGDDIPMEFVIHCDADRQLVRVISILPIKMDKEKIVEGAIATSFVNYRLADGSFDFDISDGSILFRMTSSFRESLIGDELFKYMLGISCFTVDKYNDQFFMLSKGKISIEDFIKNN